MISDPHLIHFACIAKGTTILAEFNTKDAELGTIAAKCLIKTPPFHSIFTHTIRSKTYTFLIDKPFTYFAIYDEKLENSEGLTFLKSVRDAFVDVKKLEKLSSYCYQGEFNPVFHQLLCPDLHQMEGNWSPEGHRKGQNGNVDIRGRKKSLSDDLGLKRMKNRLLAEFKFGKKNGEKKDNDEEDDGVNGIGLSREFALMVPKNVGMYSTELGSQQQRATNLWKRQVWMILLVDFVICVCLFAVWLFVCDGFRCTSD